jgi:hypothetical protein
MWAVVCSSRPAVRPMSAMIAEAPRTDSRELRRLRNSAGLVSAPGQSGRSAGEVRSAVYLSILPVLAAVAGREKRRGDVAVMFG